MMNKIIFHVCPNQSALLFRKIGKLERLLYSCISKQSYAKQSTVSDKDVLPVENIRNFSIIAHVDHGKSTLADRLLEMTGAIKQNSGKQVLDKLQVEKDRGITVKAQTASLFYTYKETRYLLNLIDTPGHVDFSAEVRHSLAPCQGVILVVDANDGVQAQTMANYQLAMQKGLFIIPVINKIDLKNAKPDAVSKQMETLLKVKCTDILKISAKLGTGVEQVLAAVVERIPPPVVNRDGKFRALIFDTWVDKYKGPISLIYVKDGSLAVGQHIMSMYSKKSYEVKALSMLRPEEESVPQLYAGQIGCIVCNMKNTKDSFLGDTLHLKSETVEPLASFEPLKPMVFSGIYPIEQSQFQNLQNAIEKLVVNDRAVTVSFESSVALGRGFRLGFLGLLHMEVFTQRLEQEFGADPIITAPSATYKAKIVGAKRIKQYGSDTITFNNPANFPDRQITKEFLEPIVLGTIITPHQYKWEIASLCKERRGEEYNTADIDEHRIMLQFILPLNEIMFDFHDVLKHITSGYASFDYEDQGFVASDLVKVCILLNSRPIDEFSVISHRTKAVDMGRKLCEKLKDAIPRQLFLIVIQASIDGKITSRQEIKPYKKDVTAKLYGGDVTRRMKLLKQQAEGKKKMRMVGNISIPRETFIDVLRK